MSCRKNASFTCQRLISVSREAALTRRVGACSGPALTQANTLMSRFRSSIESSGPNCIIISFSLTAAPSLLSLSLPLQAVATFSGHAVNTLTGPTLLLISANNAFLTSTRSLLTLFEWPAGAHGGGGDDDDDELQLLCPSSAAISLCHSHPVTMMSRRRSHLWPLNSVRIGLACSMRQDSSKAMCPAKQITMSAWC